MAEFIHNKEVWYQAYLDTPKGVPGGRTAEEAATKPGNCVKSLERDTKHGGFPKYHGILIKYGDNCQVRGHSSPVSSNFVWSGSKEEYHHIWEVD